MIDDVHHLTHCKYAFSFFILRLPDDIWMVDLDSNKLTPARVDAELPLLPEPEGTILKNHLKQVNISILFDLSFAERTVYELRNVAS